MSRQLRSRRRPSTAPARKDGKGWLREPGGDGGCPVPTMPTCRHDTAFGTAALPVFSILQQCLPFRFVGCVRRAELTTHRWLDPDPDRDPDLGLDLTPPATAIQDRVCGRRRCWSPAPARRARNESRESRSLCCTAAGARLQAAGMARVEVGCQGAGIRGICGKVGWPQVAMVGGLPGDLIAAAGRSRCHYR